MKKRTAQTDMPIDEIPEKIQEKSDKKEDTQENTDRGATIFSWLFGLGIFWAAIVWKNLPADARGGDTIRWTVTGICIVALTLIVIFQMSRVNKFFESLSRFVTVTLIVIGAAGFSIFFIQREQTVLLKLFCIVFFSFLPAWLYLDFIKTKGRTLWEEYVLNLFRLQMEDNPANLPEPPLHSSFYQQWHNAVEHSTGFPHKSTVYDKKFEGYFGAVPKDKQDILFVIRGENLWPVAMLTIMISIGLVFVTQPESVFHQSVFPAFSASNTPLLPVETLCFAFLGAYFYILQMLVRRYYQNDLKTSAYLSSCMRIIVVILLTWVIDVVWQNQMRQEWRSLLGFVIGVFPQVGWQAIEAILKRPFKKKILPSLEQKFPLNDLEGLNIWYEFRLLEEGIEDMQNLATTNIVDILLNTRIPIERLVDWINQSFLFLHIGHSEEAKQTREKLRLFGVRTATDLEDLFSLNADDRVFLSKLESVFRTDEQEPSRLRCLLATLSNEPYLRHVRYWRGTTAEEFKKPLEAFSKQVLVEQEKQPVYQVKQDLYG